MDAGGERCNSVSLRPRSKPLPRVPLSFLFLHMSPEKWRLVTDKNQTSPKIKCVCNLDSSLSLAVTANVLNDLLMLSTHSTYV